MDPYSQYKQQLEYFKYFEKQRENYIDLSKGQIDPNNSVYELAKILFNKPEKKLQDDLVSILIDENMDTEDIFCMLLELVLYGINILTKEKCTIFDIEYSFDDLVYQIRNYLKSMNIDAELHEIFTNDNDVTLYRDKNDCYCEIVIKPPPYLCTKGWYVLNYRIINNKNFEYTGSKQLEKYKAFFISKQNKIFTINFKYYIAK